MKCCEALLAYACDGHVLLINCDDKLIHVITANYGRLGSELCPENIEEPNFECVNSKAPDIVRER